MDFYKKILQLSKTSNIKNARAKIKNLKLGDLKKLFKVCLEFFKLVKRLINNVANN